MKLCSTTVVTGADNLMKKRNALSLRETYNFLASAIEFYQRIIPAYKSLYQKRLARALKNSSWGKGRICHGISMPGDGQALNEPNTVIKMQGRTLCFFMSIG